MQHCLYRPVSWVSSKQHCIGSGQIDGVFLTDLKLYHGTNRDFPEFKFWGENQFNRSGRSPVGQLGVSLARDPALTSSRV